MIERLNLEPNVMVENALGRLGSSGFNLDEVMAQATHRASDIIRNGALAVGQAAQPTSIPIPGFTDDLNWNWVHGISGGFVETWKTIAFFICLILGIIFVSIWLRVRAMNKPEQPIADQINPPIPASGGPMSARWEEIQRHLVSVKETEWKFALIEADKLVDDGLRKAGFLGDSFADRLERLQPGQLSNLDALWDAHRLRNRVAHDVNFFLRYTEAKHAIEAYGAALKELGAI
jgi:hypothetical protein